MPKQRNTTKKRISLFFPLFLIFLIISASAVFIFTIKSDEVRATASVSSYPCTGYNYSPWTTTCQNGYYTRSVQSGIPSGCVGTASGSAQPDTQRTCTATPLPCTAYTYSNWSTTCQGGYYTRSIITHTPSGCLETTAGSLSAETKMTCNTTAPPQPISNCLFTYSAWGSCQSDGTQSRTVLTYYPTGCSGGTPDIKRNCTYSAIVPTCSFTYSAWSVCQSAGIQTRTVIGTAPAGCTGGNPLTSQTCSYTAKSAEIIQSQTTTTNATKTGSTISTLNQDVATTPNFSFTALNNDAALKDIVMIGGKVTEARSVEFDLVPIGSNIFRYIGTAKNSSADYWEYNFDTKSFPNGYFYLVAKISNAYGSYVSSNKVRIKIENVDSSGNIVPLESAPTTAAPETDLAIPANFNGITSSEWQEKYFGNANCLDKNECRGESDPDNDSLSNNDEFRYRTNPLNPDTDGDGFLDGSEAKNGFNPLQFSPGDRSDKIILETPKENGEVKKEVYQIKNVELTSSLEGKKELRLSGKGLPNSFVTIYVYSDLPIILTVKTDENGNWSYILDKQIEDGEHQVYVAVTDNSGKITAKSEPLFFVKTAEAATVIPAAEARSFAKAIAPAQKRRTSDFMRLAGIIMLALIAALTAIGFFIIHKKNKGLF